MTDKEKEQWANDFDNIAIEMKEKYGVGKDKKINISQMTNEDLIRLFKIVGKIPITAFNKNNQLPITQDFVLKIMWEMNNRNIDL